MTSGAQFQVTDNNGNKVTYEITSICVLWRGLLAQNTAAFQQPGTKK